MSKFQQIMPGVYLLPGTKAPESVIKKHEKSFRRMDISIEEAYERVFGKPEDIEARAESLNSQA